MINREVAVVSDVASEISSQSIHEHRLGSQKDDFYLILRRAITSTQGDSAQLRKVIYELARTKLQKEAWLRDPPVSILEMRQYLQALEAAIERIESSSSQEDELQSLLYRMRLIEVSNAKRQTATVHQELSEIRSDRSLPVWLRSEERLPPTVQTKKIWFSPDALISMLLTAIVAVALSNFLENHFSFGMLPYDSHRISAIGETALTSPKIQDFPNEVLEPQRATPVQMPVLSLPTLYGVYATNDGRLSELELLPIKAPYPKAFISAPITTPSRTILPNRKLSFIAFRRDLMTDAPERITIRAVAKVTRSRTFSSTGKPTITNVDDLWAVRSTSYEFRVAPLSQSPEMIVVRPESDDFTLPAGRYALILKGQAYDFSVEGPIIQAAQCLERTESLNGAVYTECHDP